MSEPTIKFDPLLINVPNPSEKGLLGPFLERGLGNDQTFKRILFRLNYVEKSFEARKKALEEGNIAHLEQEVYITDHLIQDLIDIVREAMTLCAISFRQEQGPISPPNTPASVDENPPSA